MRFGNAVKPSSFNIQQLYVLCFMWISEQTAIISLYSINCLVFITETESVYCAVPNKTLNIIEVKFNVLRGLTLKTDAFFALEAAD